MLSDRLEPAFERLRLRPGAKDQLARGGKRPPQVEKNVKVELGLFIALSPLHLVQIVRQQVELLVPELAIVSQPFGGVLERRGTQAQMMHAPILRSRAISPAVSSTRRCFEMAGSVITLAKGCGKFRHRGFSARQTFENRPPGWVAKRRKNHVQVLDG